MYPCRGCEFGRSKHTSKVAFDSPAGIEIEESTAMSHAEDELVGYFKSEFNRLMSFRKCSWTNYVDPYELAANGLCYVGERSINVTTQGEDEYRPYHCCLFLHNERNKSLTEEEKEQAELFFPRVEKRKKSMAENDTQVTDESDFDSGSVLQKLSSVLLAGNKPSVNDTFKSEYQRLLSYHDWPLRSIVDPFDLANAGFYWKVSDPSVTVKCFACFGEITEWQVGEKPFKKHEQLYPSCPFVNDFETGNKKLTEVEKGKVFRLFRKRAETRDHPNIDVPEQDYVDKGCTLTNEIKSEDSYQDDDLQIRQILSDKVPVTFASETSDETELPQDAIMYSAKYPQFLSEEDRLKSFVNWPPNHCQRPKDLAEAGFFSMGKDHVVCFHCGGKLIGWERDDEPWVEHTRHYPNCEWLLKQKGRTFIKDIEMKYDTTKHISEPYHSEKLQNPPSARENTTLPDQTKPIVGEKEIEKLTERNLRKLCLDDDVDFLFLPCKHIVVGKECSEGMELCPICRRYAEEKVCIFTR